MQVKWVHMDGDSLEVREPRATSTSLGEHSTSVHVSGTADCYTPANKKGYVAVGGGDQLL